MASTRKGNERQALQTHAGVGLSTAFAGVRRFLMQGRLRYYVLLLGTVGAGAAYVTVAAHPGSSPTPQPAADDKTSHVTLLHTSTTAGSNTAANGDKDGATNDHSSSSVSISLNGHNFQVPVDGELHKDMSDDTGNTSIDVQHDSDGSGDSALNIEVESNSTISAGGATVIN